MDLQNGTVRPMTHSDIPRILAIQFQCYASCYLESAEAFLHKIVMHQDGCHVLDVGGVVAGYIVFHPARSGWVAPINFLQDMPVPDPECVYVHDLAVDPSFRGNGVGRVLFGEVLAAARAQGLDLLALAAVQDAVAVQVRRGHRVRLIELVRDDVLCEGQRAFGAVTALGAALDGRGTGKDEGQHESQER
ncbi:MAG: GNAT family N-acetyltransferase [Candidatus Undinarchaeales archaeon]|nr:GNAT family N-acetyltransferase [Candidatus Undinarchaeales archaeon]MDP7494172.1 GNAT family N-acetyltransferase [Candidatus Undinarchaeales archaeon]